ncbi:DUF4760 domain-containing protein [Afifella pfennigii]|uniref:DUF4760 domain-containing protein n=1 Tax=Afifella pfennigii TaxID=209897 RepID=UPI000479653F|nr:hypothetical protein [Afifella pfennigii]
MDRDAPSAVFVNLMTPRALLVACGVFVFLALGTLILAVGTSLTLADVGVSISLFSAVAGFLFNSSVKLHSEARDRAFDFLKEHSENEKLDAAFRRVGNFGRHHKSIAEDRAIELTKRMLAAAEAPQPARCCKLGAAPTDAADIDHELLQSILRAGNFFEVMEIATRQGAVQETIVRDYYREAVHRYARIAGPIIDVFRNNPPKKASPYGEVRRPRALIGVDRLVARWPEPAQRPHRPYVFPATGREGGG